MLAKAALEEEKTLDNLDYGSVSLTLGQVGSVRRAFQDAGPVVRVFHKSETLPVSEALSKGPRFERVHEHSHSDGHRGSRAANAPGHALCAGIFMAVYDSPGGIHGEAGCVHELEGLTTEHAAANFQLSFFSLECSCKSVVGFRLLVASQKYENESACNDCACESQPQVCVERFHKIERSIMRSLWCW